MLNYYFLKFAEALISPGDIGYDGPVDANATLTDMLNLTYFIAGAIGVIVIVVAGFYYTLSGGDAAKIKKAKDAILGAAIGLIVVMSAFVITNFIIGRF